MSDGRFLALGATAALVAFGSLRRGSRLKSPTRKLFPSVILLRVDTDQDRYVILRMTEETVKLLRASRHAVVCSMEKMDKFHVVVPFLNFEPITKIPSSLVPNAGLREDLENHVLAYGVINYDEWVDGIKVLPIGSEELQDVTIEYGELAIDETGFSIRYREDGKDSESETANVEWRKVGLKSINASKVKRKS